MTQERTLLVIGSRPGSLGSSILEMAQRATAWTDVIAADRGDSNDDAPQYEVDVTDRSSVVRMLEDIRPTDIVCTVGINREDGPLGELALSLSIQLQVNVWGPMMVLGEACDMWERSMLPPQTGFNFCAISSNSAHIARSGSAGYCASKAALSMALRCVARRVAPTNFVKVWGYEPGWINDTPMSDTVLERLPSNVQAHRIPGGKGLSKGLLANRIVNDMYVADPAINGVMFRIDGGEQ